jgi:hypothetical protein
VSFDCFDVELANINGPVVDLWCTTTTAGGVNDYADSRSFVILCLADAARESSSRCPLLQALGELGFDERATDEAFYLEHGGTFVRSVRLLTREGVVQSPSQWVASRVEYGQQLTRLGTPLDRLDGLLDEKFPRHRFLLRAELTNARWLSGLEKGSRFATTAYDVLYPDSGAEK